MPFPNARNATRRMLALSARRGIVRIVINREEPNRKGFRHGRRQCLGSPVFPRRLAVAGFLRIVDGQVRGPRVRRQRAASRMRMEGHRPHGHRLPHVDDAFRRVHRPACRCACGVCACACMMMFIPAPVGIAGIAVSMPAMDCLASSARFLHETSGCKNRGFLLGLFLRRCFGRVPKAFVCLLLPAMPSSPCKHYCQVHFGRRFFVGLVRFALRKNRDRYFVNQGIDRFCTVLRHKGTEQWQRK